MLDTSNKNGQELEEAYKVTYKSIKMIEENSTLPAIENYYGAHKNFKTEFRNKRYRHVYQTLIQRKPAQWEYMPLFYQDLLVSIIKSIEGAIISKENMYEPIECLYNYGRIRLYKYYRMFLKEVKIIKLEF